MTSGIQARTAVLIPSYNVECFIGGIVTRLLRQLPKVYVVDDGSSDNTPQAARSAGAIVISNSCNKGKGAALKEGFLHILKEGFDYILVMDGDGQHNPDDAERFFNKAQETGADMVIGNRALKGTHMPVVRVIVNKVMSFLISKFAGQDIPDTQCGFRLIKRNVLKDLDIVSSNYEAESELLIKASRFGCMIASVPIETIYHNEVSGIRPIKDTLRFIAMLARVMWGRLPHR